MYLKEQIDRKNNYTYSIDMLRLKTYITYSDFTKIEFYLQVHSNMVKKQYTSGRFKDFFYNYVIEDEVGNSFWFGFLHNTEKRTSSEFDKYNLTVEFNPNKLKDNYLLSLILGCSGEWFIKSFDLAVDIPVNILEIIPDDRRKMKIFSGSYDDKTYEIGKNDLRLKIYNKKREANLDILGDLTRVEISRVLDDYPINEVQRYKFGDVFPVLYLNQYVMSMSDYGSKTLLAILYAVQNGYPIRNLSRDYRAKIEKMFERWLSY